MEKFFRMDGKLSLLWREIIGKVNINVTDTLLEQTLFQEVFELRLKNILVLGTLSYYYD